MHDREGAEQMEMIYNWILKLSFFAVLGSVILQMIPDHGFQKICPLCPGTDSGGNAGCTGTGIV